MISSTIGIAILIFPLVLAWFSITLQGEANSQLAEIEQNKSIKATMTVEALKFIFTPQPTKNTTSQPTAVAARAIERSYVDLSLQYMGFVFLGYPFITFAMWLAERMLLPVFYPDLFVMV